ncbi:MAG: gamma carbonic anhydrase family protein [Bacteriovoracaceae bacterium]|nr:gamma carbonic anhydrase family protein [Bacteriovoracaceae bacterium]
MAIYSYKKFNPSYDNSNFLADGSTIIGRATLGTGANIWFQTVVRADVNEIKIGDHTNIQDLCMLHVTEKSPLIIGNNTSVGHQVTMHGCTVGEGCLIGMGSTLLDDCEIGDNCLVAAGSVVTPRKKFPPRSMIMGSPARRVRELTEEEVNFVKNHYKSYLGYSKEFMDPNIVKKLD